MNSHVVHSTVRASARVLLAGWCALALQGCSSGADTEPAAPPVQAPPATPPANPPANPPTNPPTNPGTTVGLDARPSNTTCLAWQRPASGGPISLQRFTALTFQQPVGLFQAPHDSDTFYVIEQRGVIRRFRASSPGSSSVYLDLTDRVRSGGEMGLLGAAFHPQFPSVPRLYLSYTSGDPLESRVSYVTTSADGSTASAGSEQIVLRADQPEDNHNGGNIAFGPGGYLFIGFGDGGGGGDTYGNGQRLTTMLGKMLRIDVDGAAPYTIPSSNPYAQNAICPPQGRSANACPEIYALGFRNPWRWSFDRTSGEMWVADVGQGAYEEVNQVVLGGNYGWRCREGAHDYASSSTPGCSTATLIDPVSEYPRDFGQSITGGFVYRGSQQTDLRGRYLFADFASGAIFAWIPDSGLPAREPTVLLESGLSISSFGQGNDGELYVVHHGGTLHRIVFAQPAGSSNVPDSLRATGCVNPSNAREPAAGLIPYSVNAPFWSDGAQKDRWLALPDGTTIDPQQGDWSFPAGSVLMKHFRDGTRLIETRLLMRHPDGEWGGYTYEWNAQQSDATRVAGGAVRDLGNGQEWIFPSEGECLDCHTSAAGRTLGLKTAQMNRDFTYPQTGRTANQLVTLGHIQLFSPALAATGQPALSDPANSAAALGDRARAYLHTNCAQCHRPGGPTPSDMDLRFDATLANTRACNAQPRSGDLGLGSAARLIAPGSPELSLVVNRMNRRDRHGMPPLGSARVDEAGVALVTQWIDSLTGC